MAGLVVVAGVSGVVSSLGDIGSATGLQLLVYTTLGIGPVEALRPVWHTAAGFLLGVAWALILILPGWLLSPHGKEQRNVAAVYPAPAAKLSAIGTYGFAAARQGVTAALNTAYDELLTGRSTSSGVVSEVLPLQRSYWVPLTVAIVLKPDYGSVFVRAVQRGSAPWWERSLAPSCSPGYTGCGC